MSEDTGRPVKPHRSGSGIQQSTAEIPLPNYTREKTYWQIRMDLKEARFKAMVDAFLCWKLPKDFYPDAGISFDRMNDYEGPHWPIGTNLFTAEQAAQMFKACIPPTCFGEDDCSSQALSVCSWSSKCGKTDVPNPQQTPTHTPADQHTSDKPEPSSP